jgi:hypothetical protein
MKMSNSNLLCVSLSLQWEDEFELLVRNFKNTDIHPGLLTCILQNMLNYHTKVLVYMSGCIFEWNVSKGLLSSVLMWLCCALT